jgi:hypothetical protein
VRAADLERFSRRSVRAFEVLYGAALVTEVVTDAASGSLRVHTGELYPWRWIGLVPLWPPWVLVIVWSLLAACGVAIAAGRARAIAPRLAALLTCAWVLTRYSNHGTLLFLVALFLAIAPPRPDAAGFEEVTHPNLGLLRAELAIVYFFTALNKITHGFLRGVSLANLLGWSLEATRPLSALVVLAEVALPFVLVWRPRLGIAGIAALHGAFVLAMPGLWSFALAMLALACLFLRPPPPREPRVAPILDLP